MTLTTPLAQPCSEIRFHSEFLLQMQHSREHFKSSDLKKKQSVNWEHRLSSRLTLCCSTFGSLNVRVTLIAYASELALSTPAVSEQQSGSLFFNETALSLSLMPLCITISTWNALLYGCCTL